MKRIAWIVALLAPVLYGQGSQLPKYTVATLPDASTLPTYTVQIIDGSTASTCSSGGGAYNVICVAHAGSWVPVSSGSTSFHDITAGTNTSAGMVIGTGASLDYAGSGSIKASNIAGTVSAGTNVTITGSGNTGSPYVIAASSGGGSVNVNGSSVSSPNFNGTTPAAPAGATNQTYQVSGSDVSSYDYGVQYSPTTTQSFFVTDSRGITSTDSLNGVGNWTATAFSCDGTTCTATVASDSFTGTSDWALIDYTTHSPTCLTAAIVPVTVINSTHFTFPESYTYCSGVTSGTGGTGNYATNMLQPLTSKQPFFFNHGTTKQLLIQSTGGGSVALFNTNFSTALTPSISACVTAGGPCYVFVSLGFDDLYATPCASVATLEGTVSTAGSYRKLFNDLHQLGGVVKVIAVTEGTRLTPGVTCSSNSQFTMSAVNQFQASLVGTGAETSGSLDYADYVIDAATALGNMDGGNYADLIHYSNSGNAVFAQAMNNGMAAQGTWNLGAAANNGPNLLHGEQMITLGASTGNGPVLAVGHSGSLTQDFFLQDDVGQPEFYGLSGNLAMVWRWNSGTSAMWDTIPNNAGLCFYNGTTAAASVDTCMWRDSGGVVDIGNTTKQDASGGLKVANLTISGTCTGCVSTIPLSSVTAAASPSGTFDFSGATQIKLPTAAGYASAATSEVGYDSTNKNWHIWQNGADTLLIPFPTSTVSGDCYFPQVTGSIWAMADAGGPCGVSGGGSAWGSLTSGTNTTMAAVIGSGASLDVTGTGTINATKIGGITVTGTPAIGNVPTATSTSAATWQAPSGGAMTNITASLTPTNCTITGNVCATTGSVSSVTLASIPSGYNNLRIVYSGTLSATSGLVCQLNGDTGSNYAEQGTQSQAATISSLNQVSQASGNCALLGSLGGSGEMSIPFYAGAAKKIILGNGNAFTSVSANTTNFNWNLGMLWNSTAAVTSIKVFPASGTIATGTSFTVYGTN